MIHNNDEPKITIITVCYNAIQNIESTILSVISQTYKNVEYIVIDGNSNDGTIDIIKKYSNSIDKWVSEPDKGIYDAMNKGIKMASGDWLNFMNAGDVFYSNDTIENIVEDFTDAAIVYGYVIRDLGRKSFSAHGITCSSPKIIDFINSSFQHQACFIDKRMFDQYGGYSTELRLAADSKFFFDVVAINHEKTKYINMPIAIFNMDGASTRNAAVYKEERELFLRQYLGNEIYDNLYELHLYRSIAAVRGLFVFLAFTNSLPIVISVKKRLRELKNIIKNFIIK